MNKHTPAEFAIKGNKVKELKMSEKKKRKEKANGRDKDMIIQIIGIAASAGSLILWVASFIILLMKG